MKLKSVDTWQEEDQRIHLQKTQDELDKIDPAAREDILKF